MTDTFTRATRIANAASFFDGMRPLLPEQYRDDAERHVEHLHDAAQILAGDRCPEVYGTDEDKQFAVDVHNHTLFQLKTYTPPINLVHWREKNGRVNTVIRIDFSPFTLTIFPENPTELRTLAAALKHLADDAEASHAQGIRAAQEVVKVAA